MTDIEAVAFDCFGTLLDFGDESFTRAYEVICREQGMEIDGKTFFDKWMDVWRRLARDGHSADGGSVGVATAENEPGPLSEADEVPPHPEHHTPSAGRNRSLDGPVSQFRSYKEEWPEHFAICFEELGLRGQPHAAHERLVELISQAQAFPESRRVVETIGRRMPIALLSNADDDFLLPALARNGLVFPVVVSSETARAYKPHVEIFRSLSETMGLSPEKILYVGDSRLADVEGAKHAGLKVAWVVRPAKEGAPANRSIEAGAEKTGAPKREFRYEADYEIPSLDLLIDILDLR